MKDTRTHILRTAARLFAQKGFSGTSLRDIVSAAGENVSAVSYHFGNKKKLYQATIEYLITTYRKRLWGSPQHSWSPQKIAALSYPQALQVLHQLLDRRLEEGLRRKNLPLERIFTQVELESARMREMLLAYLVPFHELPLKLMSKLTGLNEKSPELLFVTHSIFGQVAVSECYRLAIGHKLGVSHYSAPLRQQIKQVVWKNTCSILNSYKKGMKNK